MKLVAETQRGVFLRSYKMPRPRRMRRIMFEPDVTYFKPAGVPTTHLEEIILTKDEVEAMRLRDIEDLGQEDSSKKMNISQPTLSRILDSAHKKIADALINGKAIRIEGGDYIIGKRRNK